MGVRRFETIPFQVHSTRWNYTVNSVSEVDQWRGIAMHITRNDTEIYSSSSSGRGRRQMEMQQQTKFRSRRTADKCHDTMSDSIEGWTGEKT